MREESVRLLQSLISEKLKSNQKLIWNLEEKIRIVQAVTNSRPADENTNVMDGIDNIDIVETEKALAALKKEDEELKIAADELQELLMEFDKQKN